MANRRFWGGISPRTPWSDAPAVDLGAIIIDFTPQKVYLSMQQHIGAPCEPTVEVGDTVLVGQVIGEPQGFMSAAVHASVSGVVTEIREMEQSNGSQALTIIIENDGKDTPYPPKETHTLSVDGENLIEALQTSGIVGMGGAMFPTHVKLKAKDPIDLIILNGAECEPLQAADDALMRARPHEIIDGCRFAMHITGAKKAIVGIEDNKPDAIAAMRQVVENYPDITVEVVEAHYPQGGEKQLIQALTGREVPEGGLPSEVGIVLLNVATAATIADYLLRGLPYTHRLCTVTGDVKNPQTIRMPLGSLVEDVLAFCGGFTGNPGRVVLGGPMMGTALPSTQIAVTKGTNGLILFNMADTLILDEQPCIRCNRCAEVCPMRLLPLFIDDAYRKDDWARCEQLHAQSCINCGCCTYVCPANRRLAEMITAAKNKLADMGEEEEDD